MGGGQKFHQGTCIKTHEQSQRGMGLRVGGSDDCIGGEW